MHKAYNRTREFNFSLNGLTGFDLHRKNVSVIGTGKIGRIFIDICKGFGMHVLAYDLFPVQDSGINYASLVRSNSAGRSAENGISKIDATPRKSMLGLDTSGLIAAGSRRTICYSHV